MLDLDVFESNLAQLPESLGRSTVRVRPHSKSHKCPEIALRQLSHGAVGICCQKVSEAVFFVNAGIPDVLVTNEVVGRQKLDALARLARTAKMGVCVDDSRSIPELEQAAQRASSILHLYVEVNVGGNRCGVEPGEPVVRLAQEIARCRHVRFAGLQGYHGAAQHVRGDAERAAAIASAAGKLAETRDALLAAGLPSPRITGGGTGTYAHEAASGIYDEIQPGSYVFMDADYGRNSGGPGGTQAFRQSLYLLATVMSHPIATRAIVDVGLKAHSIDSGMPLVADHSDVTYVKASDEHGVLALAPGASVQLGQKIRLIPGHCDPTVNLHDWIVGYRGDRVETIWPIAARGAFY